jgi:hypothetical protein
MSLMTLVACGGGDGDLTGGNDGGSTPDPVTLTLSKSDGDLSGDNDITLSATVMQGSTAVANKLVTFKLTDPTLALFSPAVGTSVTDSTGLATLIVKATSVAGGVEVTASVSDNDVTDVKLGFNSVGGGAGGSDGAPVADSITLFASSQQLASSGAQEILLTVLAKSANNQLLEGVKVEFSANSGSLEKIVDDEGDSSIVTGPDGKLVMKLTTEGEPTNRIITVKVQSGLVSDSVEVEVVGTAVLLSGSSSLAIGDDNTYIVKVLNSDGTGIPDSVVALSIANESLMNIEVPEEVTTDFTGQSSFIVKGVGNGTNAIIASSLGASTSNEIAIQSDSFLFTEFGDDTTIVKPNEGNLPDILLSNKAFITLKWLQLGEPVTDGTIVNFTTTRGKLDRPSGMMVNGQVTAIIESTNAGKALVTFTGRDEQIELSNQLEFEFVADTASTIIAQALPKSIGPNGQTSTISVVVRDASGNLVKNKTVDFVLTDTSGGTIFPASAVTDSNGSASTVYTSNSTSAQNSISVEALVNGTNISTTVDLTVADRELFISLGTGNTITEPDESNYLHKYSVFVTDVDSNAVANVDLTISAIPQNYYKGFWAGFYEKDEFVLWGVNGLKGPIINGLGSFDAKKCLNEDINFNGILDQGEDTNNDGRLTPGNIVVADGNVTTDENGMAIINIRYPQSFGAWVDIRLIASTKVTGSESSTQTVFTLSVAASDINTEEITPPNQGIGLRGPFGYLLDCTKNIDDEAKLD